MGLRDQYIDAIRRAAAAGDNESANELAAYVRTNMPTAQEIRQDDFDSMSAGEQFLVGAGQSFSDVGTGLRSVFGGDTEQAEADSEMVDNVDGGWKTAGNIAGDMAMTAVPGAGAGYAAGRLGLNATRAALAAESAGVGVTEGLQEQDAYHGATSGALALAGGHVLPRVLGVGGSKGAQELAEQGVKLTPGQRWGGVVNMAEEILSYIPGSAKGVQAARDRAVQSWNTALRGGADPHAATQAIKTAVKSSYDDIFKGPAQLKLSVFEGWGRVLDDAEKIMQPKEFKQLEKFFANITKPLERGKGMIDGRALQTLDTNLGRLMTQAYRRGDSVLGDSYKAAKETLRQSMPTGMADDLAKNNRAYARFKVLESATGKVAPSARNPAGTIYPRELTSSASAGRRPQAAVGNAPYQAEAHMAGQVLSPENTVQGISALAPNVAAPFINPVTQGMLTSNIVGQAGRMSVEQGLAGIPHNEKMKMRAAELRRGAQRRLREMGY